MYSDSLKRDFSRIRSARITRKNKTLEFIAWVMFASPMVILIMFVLMFVVFQIPMSNNGHTIYPADPQYLSFTTWSIAITGFLALLFLFLGLFGKHLSKPEMIYLYEDYDSNVYLYAELKKRNVLIKNDKMYIAYPIVSEAVVETNIGKIMETRNELCFWMNESSVDQAKIKEKIDGYQIKIVEHQGFRRMVNSIRVYKNEGGVIHRIRQIQYYSTYGNQNIKSMRVDFFEDVNSSRVPSIDSKIQRKVQENE